MTEQEYIRINRKYEALFMPRIQRALRAQIRPVMARVLSTGVDAGIRLAQMQVSNAELTQAIRQLYVTVGMRHARDNYSRLLPEMQKKAFGLSAVWEAFIIQYLEKFLFDKITFAIAQNIRDLLIDKLRQGINEGLSNHDMVESLKEWKIERYRAARIVRTEVNRAANVGAKAQSNSSQYQMLKEWVSAKDFRVRGTMPKDHANHVALNGVKIDEEGRFRDPRTGDLLDIPGDPTASAATTVNCRCRAVFTLKRDANGAPIPKRTSTAVTYPRRVPTVTIPRRRSGAAVIMPGTSNITQIVTI